MLLVCLLIRGSQWAVSSEWAWQSEIATKGIRIDCLRKLWHCNNGFSNCHGAAAPAHNFVEFLEQVSVRERLNVNNQEIWWYLCLAISGGIASSLSIACYWIPWVHPANRSNIIIYRNIYIISFFKDKLSTDISFVEHNCCRPYLRSSKSTVIWINLKVHLFPHILAFHSNWHSISVLPRRYIWKHSFLLWNCGLWKWRYSKTS